MSQKIAVVGLWHLGEVYSACLAEIGHTVIGLSDDQGVVTDLEKNVPPLAEPQLTELLKKNQKAGKLSYTTDYTRVADCDIVWLTFDIPVNDDDMADVSVVEKALEKCAPHMKDGVVLAVSSQVPVGTSAKLLEVVKKMRPELKFSYFYSPENLRLGTAVQNFMQPGRIVAGADTEAALQAARDVFAPLSAEIVTMSPASAEMTKHALNAWLATCISLANDLADVCEQYGADVEEVIKALKSDPRVGPKTYLFAGLGFSGGTLGRDLRSLSTASRGVRLPVIEGVYEKNSKRHLAAVEKLTAHLGSLAGKTITLLGVTYKPGTSTLRRSQPLQIEVLLRKAGASVRLYDAYALATEVAAMTPSPLFTDPYGAAQGADAIAILSPDRAFKELDFKKLSAQMKSAYLLDAQNVLIDKAADIQSAGFTYSSIGRP